MSLQLAAKHLAAQGRGPDTTLVHMTPGEVAGLQAIARAHGGTLTINPQTGLPEAGFLSSILPAIAGAFLTPILGPWAPLLIGGAAAIASGSLEKGLMAGIGAYGGAGLADALTKTGTGALSSAAASEALPAAASGAMDTAVAQGSGLASAPSSVLSQVKNVAEATGAQAGIPVVSPVATAPTLTSPDLGMLPPAGATPSAYYGPGQGMEAATVGAPQGVTPPVAPIAPTVTPTMPLTAQADAIGNAYAQEQAAQNAVANRLGAATPMDKMKAGLSAVMDKPSMLFNRGNMSNIAMAAAPIMFGGGKMKAVPTPSGNIQYYDFDNTTNQWTYRGSVPADEVNKAGGYEAGRALINGKARGGLTAAFAAGGMARYADGGTTDTAQRNAQIRYQIGQLKNQDELDEWLQLTAFTPEQIAAAMPEYGPAKNWAAARDDAYVRWRGADSPLDAATIAELDKYARAELSGMQALRLTGGFDPQAYYEKLYSDPEAAKAYLARKTAPIDPKGPVVGGYHTTDGGYVTPTVPTWPAPTPAPAPGAPTPPPSAPAPAPYVPYTPPPFTAPPPSMPPAPPPGQSVDGFTTPGMGRISPDMYQGRSGVTGPVNWITDAYEDFWAGAPVGSTMNWAGGTLKRTGGAEAIYTAPDGTTTTLAPKSDLNIIAANNPRIGELWRQEFGLIPQNYMTGSSASAYQYLMGQGKYPVNPKGPVQDEYAAVAMGLPRTGKYIPDYTTGAMVPNPNYVEPKLPTSDNKGVIGNVIDAVTDGNIQLANGGLSAAYAARGGMQSHLGDYSDGGRLLRGPGDGVSDSIPATIANKRPARLADGEFVVPARVVSELGNGSTEAGARKLYQMMDRVQKRRRKTVGKGKVAVDSKSDKYLPA